MCTFGFRFNPTMLACRLPIAVSVLSSLTVRAFVFAIIIMFWDANCLSLVGGVGEYLTLETSMLISNDSGLTWSLVSESTTVY